MINKFTAVILILLANFILMAVAVIPHHHHKQLVCIESIHCFDEDAEHSNNTSEHRHDADKNTGGCILNQIIVYPANDKKDLFEIVNGTENLFSSFLYPISKSGEESFLPETSITSVILQNSASSSSYINTILGLRAPPSV
jgi:hypothetical protein